MGTRGLYAYRYRRRYWTRYNHFDSYPDGLGSDLVAEIPSDPEKLARWIEKKKAEFEARLADPGPFDEYRDSINDDPPKQDVFIEWTYVFDLDRLVFTVNNAIHIAFDKIPHGNGDAWTAAFASNHPARVEIFTVDDPDPRHIALYDELGAAATLVVQPCASAFTTCERIMRTLFECFCGAYDPRSTGGDDPRTGNFSATAWDIVALATWRQFDMAKEALTVDNKRRYAPQASLFKGQTVWWHRGTLFLLDAGLRDGVRLRAAVARAAEIWRAADSPQPRQQRAFIVSLRDLVVVEVTPNSVQHTEAIELVPRNTPAQDSPGFSLLLDHLTPELPADPAVELAYSEHLLEDILDRCDKPTLDAFSMTCKSVRTLVMRRPRFDVGSYRLLHYNPESSDFAALDSATDHTDRVKLSAYIRTKKRKGNDFVGYSTQIGGLPCSMENQGMPPIEPTALNMPLVSLRCDVVS